MTQQQQIEKIIDEVFYKEAFISAQYTTSLRKALIKAIEPFLPQWIDVNTLAPNDGDFDDYWITNGKWINKGYWDGDNWQSYTTGRFIASKDITHYMRYYTPPVPKP